MPRQPRLCLPGIPLHIVQRGVNRAACFRSDDDRSYYLELLFEQASGHGVAIHAWCLMANHVHLLVTPSTRNSPSLFMKRIGERYVPYINRSWRRTGTLWEGRFRSCLVASDSYVLACQRYIELNPVRAHMVAHPADYRWSSYRHNAGLDVVDGVTLHNAVRMLGNDHAARITNYRALFDDALATSTVDSIRKATNQGLLLGNAGSRQQIEQTLGRRLEHGKAGRPRKSEIGV